MVPLLTYEYMIDSSRYPNKSGIGYVNNRTRTFLYTDTGKISQGGGDSDNEYQYKIVLGIKNIIGISVNEKKFNVAMAKSCCHKIIIHKEDSTPYYGISIFLNTDGNLYIYTGAQCPKLSIKITYTK